jgi:hypothetical protein
MSITTRRQPAARPSACASASPRRFRKPGSGAGTTNWSGRIRNRCIQIAFPAGLIGEFVPWLMLNRDGLTVLLHPETGDDYTDHTAHAAWFGAVLPLRLEVFWPRVAFTRAHRPVAAARTAT